MHLQQEIMGSYAHVPMSTRVPVAHAYNRAEFGATIVVNSSRKCSNCKILQQNENNFKV